MTSYFTIDTKGTLKPDSVINSSNVDAVLPKHLKPFLSCGISRYGIDMLLAENGNSNPFLALAELIFEQVRNFSYPCKPSRLNSLFAFEKLHEAQTFMQTFDRVGCDVFLVETTSVRHCGYFPLIDESCSPAIIIELAHKYWQGKKSNIAYKHPEVLLSFPVKIIEITTS